MPFFFFRRVENLNGRQLQSRQGRFPPQTGIPLRFIAARLSGLRSATLQLKTHVRPPRLFLSMRPFRPQTSAPRACVRFEQNGSLSEQQEEMGGERCSSSPVRRGVWAQPAEAPQSQTHPLITSLNNGILWMKKPLP